MLWEEVDLASLRVCVSVKEAGDGRVCCGRAVRSAILSQSPGLQSGHAAGHEDWGGFCLPRPFHSVPKGRLDQRK